MNDITEEGAECLNCGMPLVGPNCHNCGQRARIHRTLRAIFHDLLHGVLHFEGKVWRTMPLLVWHPGRLTREYIDGRRASYIGPTALFLLVIFLFFALFSAMGGAESFSEIEVEERARPGDAGARGEVSTNLGSGVERRLEAAWAKARENPRLAIYKLQTNAYKFAWLLIPISVPFVWLTFAWRRRFKLYDHTIFTTYSISFMLALAGLASLTSYLWSGTIGALILLFAPIHLYRQLRGTYGVSRLGAAWRLAALSAFAWVAVAIFAIILAALSE